MKRLFISMLIISAFHLIGQTHLMAQVTLSGTVMDASADEPLIGASVLLKGTLQGTVTDIDGKFTITTSVDTGTVIFSFMGYLNQEMKYKGDQVFNISLSPDIASLEEVVVVAYGTQKKSHLTGAVSSLKNDGLDEIAASRADQALQGKLAGVQVLNTNAEAGSAPSIRVRGMGSISASSDPLIVIDGYPMPAGEDGFSMVNMGDVESIEVLKDAASSALYGSRAASGVILITTKSGSDKKTRYNFKMYTGLSKAMKLPDMMDIEEYVELLYSEADLRMTDPAIDGTSATMAFNMTTDPERTGYLISKYVVDEPTDWVDEALRDHGSMSSYQLSVSGGDDKKLFYLSGAYNSEDGIMEKSSYNKFSIRSKVDYKLSDRIKVGINISPAYSKKESPEGNLTDYLRFHSWMPIYHNEATAAMTGGTVGDYAQVRDFGGTSISGIGVDGSVWDMVGQNPWTTSNQTPVSKRDRTSNIDETYRVQTSTYLSVEILPGLTFKTSNSAYYSYKEYNQKEQTDASSENSVNRLSREMQTYTDLLTENILTYNKEIGSHDFGVIVGFTMQKSDNTTNEMVAEDFTDEEIMSFNLAGKIVDESVTSYSYGEALVSGLGRLTYAYKGKYLASASLRADGSTKFAKGKQWGRFPSASIGWRVSEEEFLKNVTPISNLKVRASYGQTGNNDIEPYAYMNTISTKYPDESSVAYSLGSGTGSLTTGVASTSVSSGNPDLTWEKLREINFGIDIGLIKNRYNVSVEYYNSNSIDLLLTQPSMYITGHQSAWNNIGEVNNKGIEIEIKANVISRTNFNWIITGNLAQNTNILMDYGDQEYEDRYGERQEVYRAAVGEEAIQFYGYKTDGVWTSYEEVAEAEALTDAEGNPFVYTNYSPIVGGIKVVNTDGNDSINSNDRVALGSPFPDFTWAISNSFNYKGFDLSFLIQGSQGGELINGNGYYNEQLRMNKAYTDDRFVSPLYPGDGQTTYSTTTSGSNLMKTDYFIEDASYISLREFSFGYKLPDNAAKALYLNSLRVYVSATNLVYLMGSNYRGINPEGRYTSSGSSADYSDPLIAGYQRGAYPLTRTFILGLDITF